MKIENLIIGLATIIVAIFLFIPEDNESVNPSQQYCDMWKIWHDSDGEYGWPDQERVYFKECE